jgi:putative ABC transport system ATP-binding protein
VDVSTLDETRLADLRNKTIGFVFQSFHLLARTSAVDNVALPLVYRGTTRSERRRRAREALEAVGLAHRLDHRPSQMSGGEQQRVAIARALVGDPQVVLADEPTGNLDTRNGTEVMGLLRRLNEQSGVAVVLVTHDLEVAEQARRQIHVRDGLIEWDSATQAPPPRAARSGGGEGAGRPGRHSRLDDVPPDDGHVGDVQPGDARPGNARPDATGGGRVGTGEGS